MEFVDEEPCSSYRARNIAKSYVNERGKKNSQAKAFSTKL